MIYTKEKKQRRKILQPLPAGIEIGKLVRYYAKGWRVGMLRGVKGNLAAVIPQGLTHDNKHHNAKLIPFANMEPLN